MNFYLSIGTYQELIDNNREFANLVRQFQSEVNQQNESRILDKNSISQVGKEDEGNFIEILSNKSNIPKEAKPVSTIDNKSKLVGAEEAAYGF